MVCHDQSRNRPCYFSSRQHYGLRLSDVALASAAIPGVFRATRALVGDEEVSLVDGGVSDSLPVDYAREVLGGTHLVVSDCRAGATVPPPVEDSQMIYIRPVLRGVTPFRAPRATLMAAVRAGEAAVTPAIVDQLTRWIEHHGRTRAEASIPSAAQP